MTERLWAPWRAALFAEPDAEGCIFCRFPTEDPTRDEQNLILHRGQSCFVILNKYPYCAGHLMVIPLAHLDDPARMAPLAAEMFTLASQAMEALKRVMAPDGFNLGMNLGRAAGAGIPGHGHLHVVPRWVGDNNFMPVLAERRIISEGLAEAWTRLKPHFQAGRP
jgi:ATP adenylyltransferase